MPDQKHNHKKHIVIEGPIGVGKSSLAKKIVNFHGGHLFLEQADDNPFLERFYGSQDQYALSTQLFFLFQRVQQLAQLKLDFQIHSASKLNNLLLSNSVVADFMIEKDPIFANLTLKQEEYSLYEQVYNSLNVDKLVPDLVVYLQAPVSVLKERIKKRNIRFEQKIDNLYLERLANAYTEFFHRYTDAPLLIVNAAEFNPIENTHHFTALMQQIDKIQAGKHFFNPMV